MININKVLITGGAGFIGSNLVKEYCRNNQIVVVDDFSMGKKENIQEYENVIVHEATVLDKNFMTELLEQEDFDYIFHLAAVASVADSIDRPIETNQVNFLSTLNILETLKNMKNSSLKKFVFASSAAVYGDEETLPKHEESSIQPKTPYAIDKFASEKYVLAYYTLYGVPTSCVRFFNVYGPNQNPSSPYSGVISILLDCFESKMESKEKVFNLYGDGSQTRDFVYVEDVVSALDIVAKSNATKGNVYNVGTGEETSLNNLLKSTSDILNESVNINRLPTRSGDIKRSYSSIDKLVELGYSPKNTIITGMEKYISYLGLKK